MSPTPGKDQEDQNPRNMSTVLYASRLPAGHSQALPPFRELLPPHLHDEIDSTSYLTTSLRHSSTTSSSPSHDRSLSASGNNARFLTSDPRSVSGHPPPHPHPPYVSPPKLGFHQVQAYSPAPVRPDQSHTRPLQQQQQQKQQQDVSSPPLGPSQLLPPIRDLQSFPERSLSALAAPPTPFHEPRATSSTTSPPRLDAFSQDFPRSFNLPSHGHSGLTNDDRRGAESSYVGGAPSGPSILQCSSQPYPAHPSPYPPIIHKSDSEQQQQQQLSSRQIPPPHHHHHPQSNFGIIADATDPKAKRRRGNLPKPVTDILRAWFHEHLDHPYPSEEDKQMFMTRTGLSISQISNWFINARRRQLPALRNQMRNSANDGDIRRQSPSSDLEITSQESISSPPTRSMESYRP